MPIPSIRFAAHLAAQLMGAAKAGSSISIQGYFETTPEGLIVVEMENSIPEEKIDTSSFQDAFYRGDRLQRGAGIGLWLCGETVRQHNGTLILGSAHHLFTIQVEIPLHPSTTPIERQIEQSIP